MKLLMLSKLNQQGQVFLMQIEFHSRDFYCKSHFNNDRLHTFTNRYIIN
jgi:hypothetical protein